MPGCVGLFVEAFGRVAVEDRPAERHVVGRVAVAADRHVPARHHELELVAAGMAEDRDAVVRAVAARIVAELLIDPGVPLGADDPLEDPADDRLLVFGVESAAEHLAGDFPVVGDARSQQAALRIFVIPGKTHRLALFGRERFVEDLHERFGRLRLRPHCAFDGERVRIDLCPNATGRQDPSQGGGP